MRECVGGLQADPITEDAQKVWLRERHTPGRLRSLVRVPGAYGADRSFDLSALGFNDERNGVMSGDRREWVRAGCHFCDSEAFWICYESEDRDSDFMTVCNVHKYTAFS